MILQSPGPTDKGIFVFLSLIFLLQRAAGRAKIKLGERKIILSKERRDGMKKIIIAADLGHFRAYSVTKNEWESPRVELIESYDTTEAHGKLSEKYSDANGRFSLMGGKKGAPSGNGEPHNVKLEAERRITKLIAKDINTLIGREGYGRWYLAAPEGINSQIVEGLDTTVKSKLTRNIAEDLTKTNKSEILSHFKTLA